MAVLLSLWPGGAIAETDFSLWQLETAVLDFSSPDTIIDSAAFTNIQSPFHMSHSAAVGATTAAATYDIVWAGDTGSFDMAFDQFVSGPRQLAESNANILFTSTVDLRLNVSAFMAFDSTPGDEADFLLFLSVLNFDTSEGVFSYAQRAGNGNFGQPASGTLESSGTDIILPAGPTYRVGYTVQSSTLGELNPQGPLTATGTIHFDFAPVPEPSAAWMMLWGALPLSRRSGHRRSHRNRRSSVIS